MDLRGKLFVAVGVLVALAGGLLLGFDDADTPPVLAGSGCRGPVVGIGDVSGVPNGWGPDVAAAAVVAGLPASLMAAQLEAESGWNPAATSPVGAQGIAQFMPGTWASWGNGGDPFNAKDAIAAQGRFMGGLRTDLAGVASATGASIVDLVLAGYNAGPGAVHMFNGVPPYGETQFYVAKIKALAAGKYASLDAATKPAANAPGASAVTVGAAGCGGAGVQAGSGDDLPWAQAPTFPASSPLGMFNRECVDFVLWRMNQAAGTSAAPFKFTNSNFRGDGQLLGSANSVDAGGGFLYSWKDGWDVKGWPSGKTPQLGSVVYYGPEERNPYGHVAWVKEVYDDGTFLEEGYNIDLDGSGANHKYYTRIMANTTPTFYLYLDLAA